MDLDDQVLFTWTYLAGDREFVAEIFQNGSCMFVDETTRRKLCHSGKDRITALLEDIEADDYSPAYARKTEFGIRITLDPEHLELIRQAREECDASNDVPIELKRSIDRCFDPLFVREVVPYLTVPLK